MFTAAKRCNNKTYEMGAPRNTTNIQSGTRSDRDQSFGDKIRSVEEKLG